MKQPFEQLLDECLSQLNSGTADLDAILARHPEYADRLRPLLRVARAVQDTPLPAPSQVAKTAGRQRLLMAAARKRQQRETARRGVRRYLDDVTAALSWIGQSSRPLRRAAVLVMAVLLVAVVTSVSFTQVAARSLPDTPLYPIKLASERVQLALASSPVERARLHMTFGERRLQEAQLLAEAGRPLNTALAQMVQHNKQAFSAIAQAPVEKRGQLLKDLATLTRSERQTLKQVKQTLPLSDQAAIAEAIALSAEDQARAEEAQRNPALVEFIPKALPPTRTPFVPTATATLLPTVAPTATLVEVVVPPPDKPERPQPTPAPTDTTAPPKPVVPTKPPIGEQPLAPTNTPLPTATPASDTSKPQASPTPVFIEPGTPPPSLPTVVATDTPAFVEPTGPPPPPPLNATPTAPP